MAEVIQAWRDGLDHSKGKITRCPKCTAPLVRKPMMFSWRGQHSDGAVCEKCSALWSIVGEEMEPLRQST